MLHILAEIRGLNGEIAKVDALLETLIDQRDELLNALTLPTIMEETITLPTESDFDKSIRDLYAQMTHNGLVNEVMKKDAEIERLKRNGSQS